MSGIGTRVEVELLSADLPGAMAAMAKAYIPLEEAVYIDSLHLRFTVSHRELPSLFRLAEKRGERLSVIKQQGLAYTLQALLRRPVLMLGLLCLVLLSMWMPTRIFFVQVEGNGTVPSSQILETAEKCGLSFGAVRREIRSEKIKNALLAAMPQLQWAGVNTYGCRAVITVRQRQQTTPAEMPAGTVSSMVAVRDGVVREMTVLKGNPLCKPGYAVKAGEVLISGYTDCGISIQATAADGEVYADTQRRLTAVFPTEYAHREKISASCKKYSLIIGKKRINLFKGSGISGGSCAKIQEEKYLTLPGGFQLPIALCWEQWYDYEIQNTRSKEGEKILSDFAAAYLPTQMAAGKILQANQLYFHNEGYCLSEGIYSCYEMIAITRPEERLNE